MGHWVLLQALKQQCMSDVENVRLELQHKQRQAARILKAKGEEEAIKVRQQSCLCLCLALKVKTAFVPWSVM